MPDFPRLLTVLLLAILCADPASREGPPLRPDDWSGLARRRDGGARWTAVAAQERRASRAAESASAGLDRPAGRRLRRSVLSLIEYPWEDLGYEVVFLGPRPGFRAMTFSERRRIEVYAHPGESPLLLAFDLAHELGHAYDLERNDDRRRAEWRRLRRIEPAVPWFGCERCPDYDTPAGDFAETFAYLLLGPGSFHSRVAPAPSGREAERLAAFCSITAPRVSHGDTAMLRGGTERALELVR